MEKIKHNTDYHEAFSEIDASEEVMQKAINSYMQALTEREVASDFSNEKTQPVLQPAKRKNAFSRFFFNTRKGIAAFTASIMFIIAIGVGLPLGMHLNSFTNIIGHLRNTLVDMDGVAGFGIMQLGSGEDSTPIVRGMSFGAIDGVEGSGQGKAVAMSGIMAANGDWEWTRDEADINDWSGLDDWNPEDAQVLITIDDYGDIEEVVYQRIDGRGTVRQARLGVVISIYVGTEFTFVTYAHEELLKDWVVIQGIITGNKHFGSRSIRYQTVIIHHDTGRVFPLMDFMPHFSEVEGGRRTEVQIEPLDGWLVLFPRRAHFKLRVDEQENLHLDFVHQYAPIQNVFRDIYSNYFLLNRYINNKRVDNLLYVDPWQLLYRGSDMRMYSKYGGYLRVFNAELELVDVETGLEVNLEEYVRRRVVTVFPNEFFPDQLQSEGGGYRNGWVYMVRNGYVFSMLGKVYTLEEGGRLEFLTQLDGRFPDYYWREHRAYNNISYEGNPQLWHMHWGYTGDIIGGELFVFVRNTIPNELFPLGEIIHIDFSEFSRENQVVHFNHVIYAYRMYSLGSWLIAHANSTWFDYAFLADGYYMITADEGEAIVDLIARKCNCCMSRRATAPFVEARPIFAR